MPKDKVVKLVLLNVTIVIINIILFSKPLVGLTFDETNILKTSICFTIIIMCIIIMIFGNFKILNTTNEEINTTNINKAEDFLDILNKTKPKKSFIQDISNIKFQIERFIEKKQAIENYLSKKFDVTELTYIKFQSVIDDVEHIFFLNTKSILDKINAFDQVDYDRMTNALNPNKYSSDFINSKLSIYKEYFTYVKDSSKDNEQMLLKLDQLLLEITDFNSYENGEIDEMSAMKEIDQLISKVKLYK